MDTVSIPSETVPPEMKACEQTLKRAKELVKAEPVVAYWCSFAAAQRALQVANRSGEGTKWLMSLLDALEQMKAVLATNEAVTNEAAGAAYIENFALKVFMSADNDDRRGKTGKATIRRFVVAGQFIEVLRCFENGMTEEMEQKLQYARWKAADGAKALREGRTPTSGPPLPEQEDDPFPAIPSADPSIPSMATSPPQRGSFSSQTRPTVQSASPAGSVTPVSSPAPSKAKLPSIDTQAASERTPQRSQSSNSVAWSTVATPGLPDSEDGHGHFDLPAVPSADASSVRINTPPGASGEDGERKTVRFTGPDGAPLSPAQTYFSVDSYDTPDAPPPTVFEPSPTKTQPDQSFSRPRGDSNSSSRPSIPPSGASGPAASRPRTDSSATLNGTGGDGGRPRANSASRSSPIPPSVHVSPPPPPSLASYPSAPPPSNGLGLTSPAPSAPSQAAMAVPAVPTRKQTDQAQKHAKFAVSALDYDDFATAKLELRKALALLGG